MEVDYVLVYRFTDLVDVEAAKKYRSLIQALASVGFETEVRNGENHSLLIFAKMASEEHMFAEVYRSRSVSLPIWYDLSTDEYKGERLAAWCQDSSARQPDERRPRCRPHVPS